MINAIVTFPKFAGRIFSKGIILGLITNLAIHAQASTDLALNDQSCLSPSELQKVIHSGHIGDLEKCLEVIKSNMRVQKVEQNILPFLSRFWSETNNRKNALKSPIAANDDVRVRIANVLAQASVRNGIIEIDSQDMYDYAIRLVEQKNQSLQVQAIHLLGVLGRAESLPIFKSFAQNENDSIFLTTIWALSTMCPSKDKSEAFSDIANAAPDSRKGKILERRKRMEVFFRKTKGAWCNKK